MQARAVKGKKNKESALSEMVATLYVQADSSGVVNEPNKTNNISAGVEICSTTADLFENDGTAANAKTITINAAAQQHNFQKAGDQDWVKFTAQAGKKYTLQTLNLGANADTSVYLYGTDTTTLLGSNDDADGTLASKLEWTAAANGAYYLLVKHWNPNVGGCGTTYDVKVSVTDTSTPTPTPTYTLTPGTPTVTTPTPTATPTATPGPLGKPILLMPKDGAIVKKAKAKLDWGDVIGAVTYNLTVRADKKKGPKFLETNVGVSTIQLTGIKKGKTYFWQVQACDSNGVCGKWSKPWSFKRQ